jgi:type VI secretion system protein ImpA
MVFDGDLLLGPLPDGAGDVGEDLRLSSDPKSTYFTLKDLRAAARAAEREASAAKDGETAPLKAALASWSEIAEAAAQTLQLRSKDLEVGCWYAEALVRTDGFAGLASGFDVLARLVEDYWDRGLHPPADEDGAESRLAPLIGLFGRGGAGSLVQPIKLLSLCDERQDGDAALWTIELASAPVRSESAEARKKQADRLAALIEQIKRSDPDFLRGLRRSVAAALAALDRLMASIEAKTDAGRFGSQVAEPLRAIARLLDDHVGALFVEAAAEAPGVDAAATPGLGESAPGPGRAETQAPSDREQALKLLVDAAAFFERTEPQSLIAAAIREVVRRARLSAAELIQELVPDVGQRELMLARIGIRGDF